MPTKNPRIHVVLERPLFKRLKDLSTKEGLSMSLEAREIIREALNNFPERRALRTYTGRHIKELAGKLKIGKVDLDSILSRQVHG